MYPLPTGSTVQHKHTFLAIELLEQTSDPSEAPAAALRGGVFVCFPCSNLRPAVRGEHRSTTSSMPSEEGSSMKVAG